MKLMFCKSVRWATKHRHVRTKRKSDFTFVFITLIKPGLTSLQLQHKNYNGIWVPNLAEGILFFFLVLKLVSWNNLASDAIFNQLMANTSSIIVLQLIQSLRHSHYFSQYIWQLPARDEKAVWVLSLKVKNPLFQKKWIIPCVENVPVIAANC